jgi:hypothetical protein
LAYFLVPAAVALIGFAALKLHEHGAVVQLERRLPDTPVVRVTSAADYVPLLPNPVPDPWKDYQAVSAAIISAIEKLEAAVQNENPDAVAIALGTLDEMEKDPRISRYNMTGNIRRYRFAAFTPKSAASATDNDLAYTTGPRVHSQIRQPIPKPSPG